MVRFSWTACPSCQPTISVKAINETQSSYPNQRFNRKSPSGLFTIHRRISEGIGFADLCRFSDASTPISYINCPNSTVNGKSSRNDENDKDLSIVLTTMSLISAHSATVFTRRSCRYDHSVFSVLQNSNILIQSRLNACMFSKNQLMLNCTSS